MTRDIIKEIAESDPIVVDERRSLSEKPAYACFYCKADRGAISGTIAHKDGCGYVYCVEQVKDRDWQEELKEQIDD